MKHLFIILLLLPVFAFSQLPIGSKKAPTKILGKTIIDSSLILPTDTVSLNSLERGIAVKDDILYIFNGVKWVEVQSSGSGTLLPLPNGGTITSLPEIGFNPNTTDITKWVDTIFYRSRPPTTTLTGGTSLELRSPQSVNQTLNFSAGRYIGTQPIQTVKINNVSKTIAQPSEGSYYSGTHSVSIQANNDTTFQIIATTTDGKTATAQTGFSFIPKRYWGWINISDTIGITQVGYQDSKITSLSNELSTSKSKSWNTGDPNGQKIYIYAYYSTYGDLSSFVVNGFPSLDAMNKVTRSFTNALGFIGSWTIYYSKNAQTLSSSITAN